MWVGHALRRPPGRPLLFLWLLHDSVARRASNAAQVWCTVPWRLIAFQLRAGAHRQRAPSCGRAVLCPPRPCPRPGRPGTHALPVMAAWPPVHLQQLVLVFPFASDYDLWLSACGRATMRMVECHVRCNAPAEAIAVHANEQQHVPVNAAQKGMCVVRRRA